MIAIAATLVASASAIPTVIWPHEMQESLDLGAKFPEPVPVRFLRFRGLSAPRSPKPPNLRTPASSAELPAQLHLEC